MKNTQALYLLKKLSAEMKEDERDDMAEALGIAEGLLDKEISSVKQEIAAKHHVNPPPRRHRGVNINVVSSRGDLLSRLRGNS